MQTKASFQTDHSHNTTIYKTGPKAEKESLKTFVKKDKES